MDGISNERWIAGSLCLYLSCALASCAGLGGGGLNLPILLVVFGYDYKKAVVLSLFAVLGNHCSQTFINIKRSHPQKKARPLIYWDLLMIVLPAMLAGTNMGTFISPALPTTPLESLSAIILIIAIHSALHKAYKLFKEETESFGNKDSDSDEDDYESQSSTPLSADDVKPNTKMSNPLIIQTSSSDLGLQYDWKVLTSLFAIWIYFAAVYSIMQFALTKCSEEYYLIFGVSFIIPIAVVILVGRYLAHLQAAGMRLPLEGDVEFSSSWALFGLPLLAFVIGTICVLLGLGGAELTAPVLLALGILPVVSSATTSMLSLLFSSSSLFHYVLLGQLSSGGAGAITFILGAFGGFSGRTFALYVLSKYRRASFICFALGLVLSVGLALLIYTLSTEDPEWEFSAICKQR